MKKLKLLIEIEIIDGLMYSGGVDTESKQWFFDSVLLNPEPDGELILHSNEIGDEVGIVKVLEIIETD